MCPCCNETTHVRRLKKLRTREETGVLFCKPCRKKFTVTVGTVFESSPIPLSKWVLGMHLMCSSKKGFSAYQLHRNLGVTYKTAWFMLHRIREAMKATENQPMLGGAGKTVEADETFIGNVGKHRPGSRGYAHKEKVFSIVERNGNVRSQHVPKVNAKTLLPILKANVDPQSRLMTDEARQYISIGKEFAEHGVVRHSFREYVVGDFYTNTIEGFFSIFKRGMKGVYQHCSAKHLQRYLVEFDFRYNGRRMTDVERFCLAIKGAINRRLTYYELRAAVSPFPPASFSSASLPLALPFP